MFNVYVYMFSLMVANKVWLLQIIKDVAPTVFTTVPEYCLNCMYFVFDGQFYRQIHGADMGSPVSMITLDANMEDVGKPAVILAPSWWYRYVMTFTRIWMLVVLWGSLITWTVWTRTSSSPLRENEDGSLAFLDSNSLRKDDDVLIIGGGREWGPCLLGFH